MKFLPSLKPKRFSSKYRGEECLNCQHPLDRSDAYCPSCGQPNSNKRIKLKDLIEELLGSLISYDSKLWQSLKYIFLKPINKNGKNEGIDYGNQEGNTVQFGQAIFNSQN